MGGERRVDTNACDGVSGQLRARVPTAGDGPAHCRHLHDAPGLERPQNRSPPSIPFSPLSVSSAYIYLSDPPPYTPPGDALSSPATDIFAPPPLLRASSSSTSASRATAPSRAHSTARLQFAPLQPHRTSPNSHPPSHTRPPSTTTRLRRSQTISDPPNPRNFRARARRTPTISKMSAPSSSPPPYSLAPPEALPAAPARRASSSPHLRLSLSTSSPSISPLSSQSRQTFSDYARSRRRERPTSDDDDDNETSGAETDDGVIVRRSHGGSLAATLRNRLLGKGKGKGRAFDEGWSRPITTAPGALCAGETETEGEDSPRNLPTARITRTSLSQELTLPPQTAWLVPIFFQLLRLLAVVPAVFGTLWNLYRVLLPPDGLVEWRVDYAVSMLWSILTGWQCLQLTTGLLKRWRVYYSPGATLIRLLALQAICWPATHLTLSILSHEARPLICWAAIGTTTCCSRAIQLWVTSNIVPIPPHPSHAHAHGHGHGHGKEDTEAPEHMRKSRRRRWDWAQVGVKCALPAGVVYAVMAWALVLKREFLGC